MDGKGKNFLESEIADVAGGRWITARQFQALLGVSIASFYRMEKQPGFPVPATFTTRGRSYNTNDVKAWIESRRKARAPGGGGRAA
jgi:predicted DNA-binding transcriptional regulator AlpA